MQPSYFRSSPQAFSHLPVSLAPKEVQVNACFQQCPHRLTAMRGTWPLSSSDPHPHHIPRPAETCFCMYPHEGNAYHSSSPANARSSLDVDSTATASSCPPRKPSSMHPTLVLPSHWLAPHHLSLFIHLSVLLPRLSCSREEVHLTRL